MGPVHHILALIAYAQKPPINVYANVLSGARGLTFVLSLHLHSYFYMVAAKAQASLRICAGSPEPLMPDNAISTNFHVLTRNS